MSYGRKVRELIGKPVLVLIALLLLLVPLIAAVGCGRGQESLTPTPAQTPVAPPIPTPMPVTPTPTPAPAPAPNLALDRLIELCNAHSFCTPSFWAWELELAIEKGESILAADIAEVLYGLQKQDGSWGIGTDWTRTECDFKFRTAEDAESWEVAEVGNALLDYYQFSGDRRAKQSAENAAGWLKRSIYYHDGRPYLPHMPACNYLLQPHSTINAALLLSRLEGYQELASELKSSGVDMNFLRITPICNQEVLNPARVDWEVNDFEQIMIGYYLARMGDEDGFAILNEHSQLSDLGGRAIAYAVMAYKKLGLDKEAERFATAATEAFVPKKGYEFALADWIEYVNQENIEQFYHKTLSSFDAEFPGFGVDPYVMKKPLHHPLAYALYTSAEAHRASVTKDQQALENAIRAATWLIEHNDLDGNGLVGWGQAFAWDAFGDGSINPPYEECTIITSLAIQAFLDTYDAIEESGSQPAELKSRLLGNALSAFHSFQDKYDPMPAGIVFWYSTAPQDSYHVPNVHAMFIGQLQRLSTYPIPEDTKAQIEPLTRAGFEYLKSCAQKDSSGVIFWYYQSDLPEEVSRPNDAAHAMYTLQGILDYQQYSQTEAPLIEETEAARNIQRFLEDSWVRAFPRGSEFLSSSTPPRVIKNPSNPAKLRGMGYLLYLSTRLGLNDSANLIYKVLTTQYEHQGILTYRPSSPGDYFYPRQVAHALFGLSHYAWRH